MTRDQKSALRAAKEYRANMRGWAVCLKQTANKSLLAYIQKRAVGYRDLALRMEALAKGVER